jgi:hypothetical protein
MPSILARRFFARRVSITGGAAISIASLLRTTAAVTGTPLWGQNSDGSPSGDAFIGDAVAFIPGSATVFVGYDANVANADAATTYQGFNAANGVLFNSQEFFRGPIDLDNIFLFSVGNQSLDMIFLGF